MSDFEDAKLILTPNAYKAGKAYCVKPFDGSGDFTVLRNTTATYRGENGLIQTALANEPRLNHPIGGGCPSWLIEPQATNLVTHSEDFSDPSWVKTNSGTGTLPVITANAETAPDGNLTADEFDLTGSTTARVFKINSISGANNSNQTYFSVYLKAKFSDGTVVIQSRQSDGTLISKFCDVVVSEWRRFDLLKPFNSSTISSSLVFIGNRSTGGTCNVFYVWGAQLEQGDLTSYIPTNGAAVTRNKDVFSKTGISSLIGQTEGSVYIHAKKMGGSEQNALSYFSLSDSSSSNRLRILSGTTINTLRCIFQVNGNQLTFDYNNVAFNVGGENKLAFKYKSGDMAFFLNGVKIEGSSASLTISNTLNFIGFTNHVGSNELDAVCEYQPLILFDTAKTDVELINLTTI